MMSLTSDQFRKAGMGGLITSPSPFFTSRPERRRAKLESYPIGALIAKIDTKRPLSEDEQRMNVPRSISCNEHKREVTVLQNLANQQVDRAFTFDKAQQRTIYDQAIAPIVNEVLDGFNCTVFACGQTGTGKTCKMQEAEKKARMEKIKQLGNDLNLSEKHADKYSQQCLTETKINLERIA